MTERRRLGVFLLLFLIGGPAWLGISGSVNLNSDWRTANRDSAGIAPDPASTPQAVVQVYAARAFNWRGILAVHTWIATKPAGAAAFTVHQVLGWNLWRGRSVVDSRRDIPDRRWFDAEPEIIADVRGAAAAELIPRIDAAVSAYPYPQTYRLWPGPNSNTFVAYVARAVPGLALELPPTAIGKDYLPGGAWLARAASGTGMQFSILGAVGVTAARREGLELNLLGLVFGIDPLHPAIKLPGFGRIGFASGP